MTGSGLSGDVLAGRFFGRDDAGVAARLAAFIAASGDVAGDLRSWFGGRAVTREAIDREIAAIDALVHEQLEAVFSHPRLQQLEGSWRGLRWLAEHGSAGARVQVRVLLVRWPEICRDFQRATEFDQSNLFRLIYEAEFGQAGGEPYGLLLVDHAIRPGATAESPTDDIAALDALAGVAAAAFSPLAIAAHPSLLGLDDFAAAPASLDLTDVLRAPERRRWRSLQQREDARFVAVLLPRVLARAPWADDVTRADGFRLHGRLGGRVWMSPAYALAAAAMRAFSRGGWPADIRGAPVSDVAQGGVVEDLPQEHLSGDPPGAAVRPPVEVCLSDAQERQLIEAGLLPLIGLEGLGEVTFAATPSLHVPPRMTAGVADANQMLSAQFNAILCVSRFAHCVKIMGRDMVGSIKTAEEIELRLQRWIGNFVNSSGGGMGESAARYPLRGARVEVSERPGRPGVFGCTIHLQPHYQLDELSAAFRLVTDLQGTRIAA